MGLSQLINKHNDTKKRDELVHGILKKVYGDDSYEKKIKPLKDNELRKKLNLYHKAGATLDLNNSSD